MTARRIADALGVPVIDPVIAAYHRAAYAARLKSACGSGAKPAMVL